MINTHGRPATSRLFLAFFLFGGLSFTASSHASSVAVDDYTVELYDIYCTACHAVKASGAPQAFTSEWHDRLDKGMETLVNHAINGIGNMPPMGTCVEATCDPLEGCKQEPNDYGCQDGSVCTVGDLCVGGSCIPGDGLDCEDGNPCTDDGCDPVEGCFNEPRDGSCDDGDPCTLDDTCEGGLCRAGAAQDCDDGEGCTEDSCDPGGACVHIWIEGCETSEPDVVGGDTDSGGVSGEPGSGDPEDAVGKLPPLTSSGCGCRTADGSPAPDTLLLTLLIVLALARRRATL